MKLRLVKFAICAFLAFPSFSNAGDGADNNKLVMEIFLIEPQLMPGGSEELITSVRQELRDILRRRHHNVTDDVLDTFLKQWDELVMNDCAPVKAKVIATIAERYSARQLEEIKDFMQTEGGKAIYNFAFKFAVKNGIDEINNRDFIAATVEAISMIEELKPKFPQSDMPNSLDRVRLHLRLMEMPTQAQASSELAMRYSLAQLRQIFEFLKTDGGSVAVRFVHDAHSLDVDLGWDVNMKISEKMARLESQLMGDN